MPNRGFVRIAAGFVLAGLLAACHGGGQVLPATGIDSAPPVQQDVTLPNNTPISTMSLVEPSVTSFLPSSWGKIGTFQIFDETNNGTISATDAAAHGGRYSSVWVRVPAWARHGARTIPD